MGLETGTYISDLVPTNPAGTDSRRAGDDHLRLIKDTLQNTFPQLTGAVTATQAEINKLDGLLSTTAELNLLQGLTAITGSNTGDEIAATTNDAGIVELATQAEVDAGVDTTRVVTPATLDSVLTTELAPLTDPARSVAASGYYTLPGGLILQWGKTVNPNLGVSGGYIFPTTFPIAFPTAVFSITVMQSDSDSAYSPDNNFFLWSTQTSLTAFEARAIGITYADEVYWMALGY